MPLSAGTRLGPYEILAPIGEGGMGEVYRAKDSRLGRDIAIKVLPEHLTGDPQARARFERETRAAAALNHPNIVAVYDVAPDYVVMELVEGQSLRQLLVHGALSSNDAIGIGAQIAEGLAAAHAAGIVHRDLKPENVVLGRDGRIRILDFGLAKRSGAWTGESTLTAPGLVMGTVGYMSPEQVRGQETDSRTDIFSLGLILYEMASGRRAFACASAPETMAAILREPVPEFGADISRTFQSFVLRCLEKTPERRFQSARDLAFSLRSLVTNPANAEASPGPSEPQIDSLIVMPFENAGGNPDTDYLSEGITESIINQLSQLSKLRVVPRNSAFRYKGREVSSSTIRQELGVRAVVTGRVMQRGESLVVGAELVDIVNDCQLWGERYVRKLSDIFAVQDEIAAQISGKLRLRLTREEKQRLIRRYTDNRDAYQLYIKGRHHWGRRTLSSLKLAVECFQQAIQEDPLYALAYAGLADVYMVLGWYGVFTPSESLERSKGAAAKAVEIDPELAEAYAALGFSRGCDRDWAGSEAAFERALQINPGYWLSYDWYALCLSGMGRSSDAVAAIKKAQQIDPLSLVIYHHAAWVLLHARRHEEAIEQCRRGLDLEPDYGLCRLWLGLACTEAGRHEEALSALKAARNALGGIPLAAGALGHAYARAGYNDEAGDILGQLTGPNQQFYVDPYQLALIHTGLGQVDRAFEYLEKAYRERSLWLAGWTRLDPRLDRLRDEARFIDLLRRIGGKSSGGHDLPP